MNKGEEYFNEDKFIKIRLETHSKQWFDFRTVGTEVDGVFIAGGIGASETGKITGKDKYEPVAQQLFYQKIGTETPKRFDNPAMFHGRHLENYIKEIWQCYDGTEEGYIEIFENWKRSGHDPKELVRQATDIGYILINMDHPQLFASLDFGMVPGSVNMITGESLEMLCPLETKTIQYWASQSWEDGIPPTYLDQVEQQMMVTGAPYSEIAMLQDGREFKVFRVEENKENQETISELTRDFWFGRVLPGRKLFAEMKTARPEQQEMYLEEISRLEPPPSHTPAYAAYISQKYLKVKEFAFGSDKHFAHAHHLKVVTELKKEIDHVELLLKNQWLDFFNSEGLGELRFGTGKGKISVNKNVLGNISLRNSLKSDFKSEVKDLMGKLNL